MKNLIRKLKIIKIDVFVYVMTEYQSFNFSNPEYTIEKTKSKKKWRYAIRDSDKIIHKSYLFHNVYLLKLLKKNGPVIGDCKTNTAYRGQSIYPFVINSIAQEIISNERKEVFIIVNQDNLSSIKGIEKAGFSKYASIKAKRWVWFYLKKQITYLQETNYKNKK